MVTDSAPSPNTAPSNVFSFNHALQAVGVEPAQVRLVRHQERGPLGLTPYDLWVQDPVVFDSYQSKQAPKNRNRFGGLLPSVVWATFVVPPNGSTLFVGLYDVTYAGPLESGVTHEISLAVSVPGTHDRYALTKRAELSDFAGRLFVHWGEGHRAWVQRADRQDKAIVELRRSPFEPAFPGLLVFREPLSKILALPASWQESLKSTKGVYLLACPRTGVQYVGSATGEDGFLGRWTQYVKTGHGGNVGMMPLDTTEYLCSILEMAGSGQTTDDILRREKVWKEKLSSRTIGLNRN